MFFKGKSQDSKQAAARALRIFKARLLSVKVAFLLFFVLIAWRLMQVQIVEAGNYQEIARRQYEIRMLLPASKGCIFDRNGNVLVSNSMFVSFAADPKIVDDDASRVAEEFSRIFGKPKRFYVEKLKSEKRFVWLERRVLPDLAKRLNIERFGGVVAFNEPKRLYHYDEVAGQLLGFTDIDNNGLSGLELQFDGAMRGKDGYVVLQRDGLGNRRPSVDYPRVEPTPGPNLYLTIDLSYQSILEEELARGIKKANAESGLAAMMNPRTGEILAVAQYPGVNPNEVGRYEVKNQKLRAVTDMFEPGSIFKLVTASAALEAHLISPDQKFFAENGEYKIALRNGKARVIKDTHEYGWITFQEAMELSSNVVMAKVSDIIGSERLYRKAREFGFTSPTGIEIPGEIRGDLKKPSTWSSTTLNTVAYGYEVGVTPIQLLAAYGAVANGGILLKPYVLKNFSSTSGEILDEGKPKIVRRAISEETAQTLTRFFEGVVERGTATAARIEGVRVAGKTGTSKKHIGGRYQAGSYTASFIGFFPAEDPQVICLVMIDNPRKGSYYGGQVAAPVFRAVAERIINTSLQLPRRNNNAVMARADSPAYRVLPDVCNLKLEVAQKNLVQLGIRAEAVGEGEIVLRQFPEPGSKVEDGETVRLFLSRGLVPREDGYVEIPDLRGLSLRRAMNRLSIERLLAAVNGSGVVTTQVPSPGERVKVGTKVAISCEPKRFASTAAY